MENMPVFPARTLNDKIKETNVYSTSDPGNMSKNKILKKVFTIDLDSQVLQRFSILQIVLGSSVCVFVRLGWFGAKCTLPKLAQNMFVSIIYAFAQLT